MIEIWDDIPGYEGMYQASTQGRIRSLDRLVSQKGNGGKVYTRKLKGVLLTPKVGDAQGHLVVRLNSPRATPYVHRLVLLTFVGPSNGRDCRHLDGSKDNNCLSNLAYGSRRENSVDMVFHETMDRFFKIEEVKEIKRRLADGEIARTIAQDYGVHLKTVQNIRQGKTYAYVEH
ncbi:MAG: NUMOD4 domain-containing protein [Bacillota bacterium]